MLLLRNILITFMGYMLYMLTAIYPLFKLVYFDYIALIVITLPWILDVYNMYREGTLLQTDTCRKWETITDYIDRNRDVHTLKTIKPYHTQSFLEAKGFGIIENKGKDSVLKKGTKKYVLALENCEHTPDPDMLDASDILYNDMGIRDTNTLKKLLTGQYLNAGDYKVMGHSMVAMMTYHQNHGGQKLINEWKQYDGKNRSLKPTIEPPQTSKFIDPFQQTRNNIDAVLKKRKVKKNVEW